MSKPTNDRPLGILDIEISDQMGDPLLFTPNRMAVAAMLGALPFMESEKMTSILSGDPGIRLRTSELDVCLPRNELVRLYRLSYVPAK